MPRRQQRLPTLLCSLIAPLLLCPPRLETNTNFLFEPVRRRVIVSILRYLIRTILLITPPAGIIVRILIANAVPDSGGALVVPIPQVGRHRILRLIPHICLCIPPAGSR